MQYFKHQSNMRHDIKIKRIISKYGLEGYGLYNLIIESITESLSTDSPLPDLQETCEDIAEFYNGNTAKINEIMSYMLNQGLFDLDELTGKVLCNKVYKFLDTSQTRSEKVREMIKAYKTASKIGVSDMSGRSLPNMKEEEEKRTEEETEQNRKEEEKNSPPSPDPDSNRQRFIEIKNHWKSKKNLPQSKLLDANMSVGHEALDMLKVFPNEDIFKAINNFDKCFTKIEAKYRIKSFSNFMTIERIELWLSDATVEEYYPKEISINQKEINKIDEFLEIVKTNYSDEQKKPYLEKRERFVKLLEAENG